MQNIQTYFRCLCTLTFPLISFQQVQDDHEPKDLKSSSSYRRSPALFSHMLSPQQPPYQPHGHQHLLKVYF